LWIPDLGGRVFAAVERLLDATTSVTVATGVLNLWKHSAEETAAEHNRLAETYDDRWLLGIGVSHAVVIDANEPGRYAKPLNAMNEFLDKLDAAVVPVTSSQRVVAALGPKMLELARTRAAGVHSYNATPAHTALVRAAIGTSGLVIPEQAVALTNDPVEARALGREHLAGYFAMPNYVNNWRRLGFDDDDFAGGGSNRLVDAVLAWGGEEAVGARVREHFDAGADHVCIQVVSKDEPLPRMAWRSLAPVLIA